MKLFFLLMTAAFSFNAISQTGSDFKPNEIFDMLDRNADYCSKQLTARGYEYAATNGDTKLYRGNGNIIAFNYPPGKNIPNVIVFSTLYGSFISKLRLFMSVGFYNDPDKEQAWKDLKGTRKINFIEKVTKEANEDEDGGPIPHHIQKYRKVELISYAFYSRVDVFFLPGCGTHTKLLT